MSEHAEDDGEVEQCPGCGEPAKKLDGDDWQDQNAYVCNENPCGVYAFGDGDMPGYSGGFNVRD